MRIHSFIVCLVTVIAFGGDAAAAAQTNISGSTMGTTYSVMLAALPVGIDQDRLHGELDEILDRVDAQMSTYRDDSEVSRFNASSSTAWFPVSAATREVVAEARHVGLLSHGAFDLTVVPLVELWGIGRRIAPTPLPSDEAIRRAAVPVGFSKVETRKGSPAIRKQRSDMRIDLSAIAKGFAVDRLATHLESRGIEDYLVEIGGELRVGGTSPAGGAWRVAIERPSGEPLTAQTVVALTSGAVATSGDYRAYFEHGGRRYSHIIDPRTGRPVAHELVSVTVVDRSAMRADAYATALLVLGPRAGLVLAAQQGLAALFVSRERDGFIQVSTPQFEQHVIH